MYSCQICKKKFKTEYVKNILPTFRHLDFKKIDNSISYKKCSYCQIISLKRGKENRKAIKNIRSAEYSKSNQTNQKKRAGVQKLFLNRSQHQARYIFNFLKGKKNKILDVGCYDGKLLNYLSKLSKGSYFYGTDINSFIEKKFPKKKNFFFIKNNLSKINFKFDFIILSHSIFYIENLKKIMKDFNNILTDNGKIFIQIPDIKKNIYNPLMGDQYYFFTSNSLNNLCKIFNFKILKIDKIFFPNELIFILKKNKIKNKKLKIKKDNIFEKNIILLKKIKKKLINYKKYKNFVLGTTVNASFVDEIIRDSVTHFVDENLSRNKKFREKKIIHPKKIINNQNVIVPYENKYAKKIILNLKKKYKGNYFKI